jgi:branched-chain amino acid transport system permease protein
MNALGSVEFWAFVGVTAGIYTIFGLGLQVQLGFAGLLNFGHVAFMAIGAYTMAILTVKVGVPWWLASLAGIATAVVFGLMVGLSSLRLRTDYFAIATFALAEIVRYTAMNATSLTGGSQGTVALGGADHAATYNTGWLEVVDRVRTWLGDIFGTEVTATVATLVIVWAIALAAILVAQYCVHRPWGRVLRSIREDEDAAAALGKNAFSYKLQALAFGGALGAIAGILYAFQLGFFGPADFDPLTTLIAFMVVIIAGNARNWGVPLGALVYGVMYASTRFLDFAPFSYFSSAQLAYLRLVLIGVVLVGLMAFRPQGIFGKREELVLD